MDHDISMLVPEIWCRMRPRSGIRDFLIENGYLEKVGDFDFEGRPRFGEPARVPDHDRSSWTGSWAESSRRPDAVLTEAMLRPEQQDMGMFADGVGGNRGGAAASGARVLPGWQRRAACPPLRAVLHLMAHGHYLGMTGDDPDLRALFTRESVIDSEWYLDRLRMKQTRISNCGHAISSRCRKPGRIPASREN